MATFIACKDETSIETLFSGPDLIPVGYLPLSPDNALKQLLPSYYVVDYLGLKIPSRSRWDNLNHGLTISQVNDGLGINGTIELLNHHSYFRDARHEFTDEERKTIVDIIKQSFSPLNRFQEPVRPDVAEKYSLICDVLGFPLSVDEIKELSTHKEYYDPIPLRRFYS